MSDVNSTTKIRLSNHKFHNLNMSNWQESLKLYAVPKLSLDQQVQNRRTRKLNTVYQEERRHDVIDVIDAGQRPHDSCNVIDTSRPIHSTRAHHEAAQAKTDEKSKEAAAASLAKKSNMELLPFQRMHANKNERRNQAVKATSYAHYQQNKFDKPSSKSPLPIPVDWSTMKPKKP